LRRNTLIWAEALFRLHLSSSADSLPKMLRSGPSCGSLLASSRRDARMGRRIFHDLPFRDSRQLAPCPLWVIFARSTRAQHSQHLRFGPIASHLRHRSEVTRRADVVHHTKKMTSRSAAAGQGVWPCERPTCSRVRLLLNSYSLSKTDIHIHKHRF